MNPPPFGVSQYTTWPQTFEQDLALYREAGVEYIEVCEGKLDPADPQPQLRRLRESGLKVASIQPRLHSLFPDAPHRFEDDSSFAALWTSPRQIFFVSDREPNVTRWLAASPTAHILAESGGKWLLVNR